MTHSYCALIDDANGGVACTTDAATRDAYVRLGLRVSVHNGAAPDATTIPETAFSSTGSCRLGHSQDCPSGQECINRFAHTNTPHSGPTRCQPKRRL